MRKQIVAGNWKMNKNQLETLDFAADLVELSYPENVNLLVIPPAIFAKELVKSFEATKINVGVQNCSEHDKGAFTGEISANMIASIGARYVIIGHSERRAYHAESNSMLALKVNQVLDNKLTPIYCCGEALAERENQSHFKVIKSQIEEGLFHLSEAEILNCVIAYEPVWAIGTGVTATSDQAQEMHAFIRNLLQDKYNEKVSESISILYGGSCKPANAQELFQKPDVDGGLIGGASLIPSDFIAIANSFAE